MNELTAVVDAMIAEPAGGNDTFLVELRHDLAAKV